MKNLKDILEKRYTPTTGNTFLLILVIFTIFMIPIFPMHLHRVLYNISFTAIFFTAILSIETERGMILWVAVVATVTEWLASYLDLRFLIVASYSVNVIFFSLVVFKMIYEIARTRNVNVRVILEAINCYLLIGFIFGLLVTFLVLFDTKSYNFTWINDLNWEQVSHVSEFLYYTFVTFTTLGYGEIIPQTPVARSLAILISVTGQIYIAVIIALLVGKFASSRDR